VHKLVQIKHYQKFMDGQLAKKFPAIYRTSKSQHFRSKYFSTMMAMNYQRSSSSPLS